MDKKFAARKMLEVYPRVMCTVSGELRRMGHPSYYILLALLAHHAHNLSALADHQGVSLPSMSSTMNTLEERGWVRRRTSPRDRRVVLFDLTPEGESVYEEMQQRAVARLAEQLGPLSSEEIGTLLEGVAILEQVYSVSLPAD